MLLFLITHVGHDGQAKLVDVNDLKEATHTEDDVILRKFNEAVWAEGQGQVAVDEEHVLGCVRQLQHVFEHLQLETQ